MKSKKTLSSRLTNRFLLIIRNEENFAEKTTFSFNYAKLIVFFLSLFIIFLGISLYLVSTILGQWFDPRHAEVEANRKLIALSMQVDSMVIEMERKEQFIANFQSIVEGDGIINDENRIAEQESEALEKLNKDTEIKDLAGIDSEFRKEFEEEDQGIFSLVSKNTSELQETYFFSPISGIVSSPYNPKSEHFGVDIVAKKNEPVKCVADGTVVFADWNQEAGYVMAVQHRNNLISVYKHNSALLKKVGTFVNAGDIIGIIGNSGELTTGPHLHLEFWYNGNPANPEDFVSF